MKINNIDISDNEWNKIITLYFPSIEEYNIELLGNGLIGIITHT